MLRVYDGANTVLGAATVNGLTWSFTTSPLANGKHTFTAVVSSADGVEGQRRDAWVLNVQAATPSMTLAIPTFDSYATSSSAITLTWAPISQAKYYQLFRNNVLLSSNLINTFYIDTGLTANTL